MSDAIVQVQSVQPWTCPSCKTGVVTPCCPQCGERPLRKRDLTFAGLLVLVWKAFSDVDGRLIRTLRCLVNHPGMLTLAYIQGERQRYLGPFALFFSINALFFVTQSLTGVNIFSSPLESHLYVQDWSALAQSLVAERMAATQTRIDAYAILFDKAVVINAKSLIVLMTVPFALLLPAVFVRSGRPFVAHVVFSLHLYAFLLVLFCVMTAVAAVDVLIGGEGLGSARMDNALSLINVIACAMYLYFAAGKVYAAAGMTRVVQVLALTISAAAIVVGYRFVVFLITFYGA